MTQMNIDPVVRDYCSNGLSILVGEWKGSEPALDFTLRNNLSARKNALAVEECINELLRTERVYEIRRDEVLTLNPLTMVIKRKTGKKRLCIDLSRRFNPRVEVEGFRISGVHERMESFRPGTWMCKLDLKNGYLHIPMHPDVQKHLSFEWKKKFYCFSCLPFGVNVAPLYFQHIMNSVLSSLEPEGIFSTSYIDDVWIEGKSPSDCRRNLLRVMDHLKKVGFTINRDKSVLHPTQKMEYLGVLFDGKTGEAATTPEKIIKLQKLFGKLRNAPQDARLWRKIAGFLNFLVVAVPEGRSHIMSFYRADYKRSLHEMRWWMNAVKRYRRAPRAYPSDVWTCDASATGKGAWNTEGQRLQWNEVSELHSNIRELTTVVRVLEHANSRLRGQHIHFRMDNTSSISTINKGGSKSFQLNAVRKRIWTLQRRFNVMISASFIAGKDNRLADALSRQKSLEENEIGEKFTDLSIQSVPTRMVSDLPIPVETLQSISPKEPEIVARESWKGTPKTLSVTTLSKDSPPPTGSLSEEGKNSSPRKNSPAIVRSPLKTRRAASATAVGTQITIATRRALESVRKDPEHFKNSQELHKLPNQGQFSDVLVNGRTIAK